MFCLIPENKIEEELGIDGDNQMQDGGCLKVETTISYFARVFAFFLMFTGFAVHAGKTDTPERVIIVAKQGSIESADIFVAVHEANSFLNRLSTDRAYAGKFLEAVQKNDPGVVVSVVKQTAPRCQVFVPQLKPDFFAIVEFKIKTRNVTVCLSGENACSGQPATVDVK